MNEEDSNKLVSLVKNVVGEGNFYSLALVPRNIDPETLPNQPLLRLEVGVKDPKTIGLHERLGAYKEIKKFEISIRVFNNGFPPGYKDYMIYPSEKLIEKSI
ncbi:hypothetical protein HY498_04215 [Candidatus Woesearchaeota archaeon]|nr:hypothetical protein [Candidatus Woesearchaeota archaeon]